ncbi:MAG TPA: gamma-glutamyltransferase [Bacilli bacterium]|jgi:gamma-glutamyltranspeptidase/glutathione hydrolase|nr:gamma-glutamyltransferase [Bacilli bacterium]HOR95402.1 gamma-glutamyltransferase [Bacilli bacterium]HPD11858.1 gamma-glutamyltransferase [Bacilli bacterium]HRS29976.1 gamma-glutamyltransferase [Bacilli bacterium]HRU48923.1 gamma-glutamyltransferase [Bacilli bacterium]
MNLSLKKSKLFFVILLLLLAFTIVGCKKGGDDKGGDQEPDFTDLSVRDVISSNGVVSAASPYAAKAGLDVLKAGGNAFDAAVAVSFALGVVEPNASGIGGGGIMVAYEAKTGQFISYNFREFVPAAGEASAFPNRDADVDDGIKASGVPTQVIGLLTVLENHGNLDRQTVMAPAIRYAKDGFPVTPELANAISENFNKVMRSKEETKNVFADMGITPLQEGDLLVQANYGKALEMIAQQGASAFYEGEIADAIVALQEEKGGLITHDDLLYAMNNYPIMEQPIQGTYRGYDIATVTSPSSGGMILLEALNMLEVYGEISGMKRDSAELLHVLAVAQQLAYGDKRKYIADTKFVDVPIAGLINKQYAAERWQKFDPARAYLGRNQGDNDYGNPWPYNTTRQTVSFEPVDYDEHYSTTTFSVVDKEGNIVSVTQTINYFFGNGLVVPGFGFFMNNQLSGFSFTSSSASYIQPYKQPVSHIMPTIVMKDGNPYATLGSPGSMRIPAAVLQVLINMIDFGMNIQEAIEYPRIYCYAVGSDETYTNKKDLYLEQAFDDDVRDGLRALGYNLIFQGSGDIDLYFGGVQGVRFIDGNKMHGGADPRRDGKALGY